MYLELHDNSEDGNTSFAAVKLEVDYQYQFEEHINIFFSDYQQCVEIRVLSEKDGRVLQTIKRDGRK